MVRCKFYCESKTKRQHWDKGRGLLYDYNFNPVSGGSPENEQFWTATPAGNLKLTSVLSDAFEVGREYYLDIEIAQNDTR
jgi:hypothetical protein